MPNLPKVIDNGDDEIYIIPNTNPQERKISPFIEEEDIDFPTSKEIVEEDLYIKKEFVIEDNEQVEKKIYLPAVNFKNPIPQNVISVKKQARLLGWTVAEVNIANRITGVFTQLPMSCTAHACKYAPVCPIINKEDFLGKPCPLQLMEVLKHFTGYVTELNIHNEDYTDMQTVADLCRLHLIMWRCDKAMQLESDVVEETEKGTKRTLINQHRELQVKTRLDIQKIYNSLISTRKDKKAIGDSKNDSFSVLMAKLSGKSNVK